MIEPFKLVGQLIALKKDDAGNVIGELHVADLAIYAAQFDDLRSIIEQNWPLIVAEHEGSESGPSSTPQIGSAG